MSEKLIQIVDDNDRPIGSATMQQAWKDGLTHRIVRVMVEDSHGKVLLQKRAVNKGLYPGCWDNSAAGHVDAGESYDFAAARELGEEIGLKNAPLQGIGTYFQDGMFEQRKLRRFTKVYKTIASSNTKFKVQANEVSRVRWFSVSEVKELLADHPDQVSDGLVDVFEKYYSK